MRSVEGFWDKLEDQRREAYVRAVLRASEFNDVVGYTGCRIPLALFYALGLMALPVYGIDGDILRFSVEQGLCAVIDATLTYAKTDRCPLIHSSRVIVVDDACSVMAEKMSKLREKDVYLYHGTEPDRDERLAAKLEETYGRRLGSGALEAAASELRECAALLRRLKYHSDLSGLHIYILEYYLNFLPLSERRNILREVSERVAFFEEPVHFISVHVQSGAGIYRQIDRLMAGRNYRIMEAGCCAEGARYDFVYKSCPFAEGTRIDYERS